YIYVRPKEWRRQAAIWHAGSGVEYVPLPSGAYASEGGLMSADATEMIVNGSLLWRHGQGDVASITGMDMMSAMSGDGGTVVGRSNNTTASRWTQAAGAQLIQIPGATYSEARAVSPDGTQIVGRMSDQTGYHAFIWDAQNGGRILTSASGPSLDVATGISADGSVIVGYSSIGGVTQPVVWTPSGSSLLSDILHEAGIHDLDGYNPLNPVSLSTDGARMLVNDFGYGSGQWIVTIPGPGAMAALGAGLALASRRRRA